MKKKLSTLISDGVGYVKTYWSKPPSGKALSVKEWVCYCLGGMGAVGATVVPSFITMGAGAYIAVALNVNVDHIFLIGILSSVFTIASSPLISYVVDNTNSKYGKFRPYLIWMPIPIFALFLATAWIPTFIQNYVAMLVVYTILYNLLQLAIRFYTLGFTSIIQVISPSPEERTNLMSIGTVATSLGPSIVTMLYPLIANFLFTEGKVTGVNQIGSILWIAPAFMLAFLGLGYFVAFGTKERMVLPKKFKQKQRFFDGLKKTAKNKYFWLSNVSSAVGVFKIFLATTFTVWICNWVIAPQLIERGLDDLAKTVQTLVVGVMGFANVPGMLLAPLFIKKFGKRNVVVFSNLFMMILTIPAVLFTSNPYLLLVIFFLQNLMNGLQVVTGPAMGAQIYDYQQYKTGDRLEGFISQFGSIILTAIGMGTAYVAPAVYKMFGYIDKGEVLLDNEGVLFPIIKVMGYIAIGSGVLGTIPMLFWDLSEKKHDQIMEVLRVRSKYEDGECTAEERDDLERKILSGDANVYKEFFGEDYVEDGKSEDEKIFLEVASDAGEPDGAEGSEAQTGEEPQDGDPVEARNVEFETASNEPMDRIPADDESEKDTPES